MLFGWGGADSTGLPDGQGLIEEVVFERRAEGGESVNPTNTGSKNMKSSTNSTSKVLKQDRAGQAPGMARRPGFGIAWSKEEQQEKGQRGDKWPNYMGHSEPLILL